MKIDGIGGQGRPEPSGKIDRREESARSDRPETTAGDRVEVSASARRMSRLVGAANRLPEVRTGQVEALRDVLRGGTYEVEPRALARSILEFEDGLYR